MGEIATSECVWCGEPGELVCTGCVSTIDSSPVYSASALAGELMEILKGVDMAKAVALVDLPERIAKVIALTFECKGDDATLADDEALSKIRDLLVEYDPQILDRNAKKAGARR